jgi:uncharacterized protein YsxB (DUF464 family)
VITVSLKNIKFDDAVALPVDGRMEIIVEGHALSGRKGEDIVCAGVSALVQSCIASITKIAGFPQNVSQDGGFISSSVDMDGADPLKMRYLEAIIGTMLVGLQEIRKSYPDKIEIIFF